MAHVRVRPIVLLIVGALLFGLLAMPATAAPHAGGRQHVEGPRTASAER